MIKLFVSDLDGTLLNNDHVISPENAQAILRLEEAGIEFMVATGRTYLSAKPLLDQHGINCRMINYNGAAIYDQNGQVLKTHPIKDQTVKELLDYFIQNKIEHSIMALNNIYIAQKDKFIQKIESILKQSKDNNSMTSLTASQFEAEALATLDLNDFQMSTDNPVLKIMVMDKDPEKLKSYRKYIENYPDLDVTSSSPDNLEVTQTMAQKGLAISEYARANSYTMDQVLTIGDSLNDRSMLKMAGYSYAMANASDEVKKIAKYQAPHNHENGVAQVINSILEKV